jgi:hypothetical protein
VRARLAIAAAAAAVLTAPGAAAPAAGAATLAPVHPSATATTGSVGLSGPLRDRVLAHRPARARGAVVSGATHDYRTADGLAIEVQLSGSFADTPANRDAAQTFVDFMATRLHGSELGRLRMFIGTPGEVNEDCGGQEGVAACYIGGERRITSPARTPRAPARSLAST